MRRRIFFWTTIVAVPLALVTAAAGTAAAFPVTRHIALAWWNLPDRLPALAENPQVHFEPGAEGYARDVAALLPAAIARIEAAHGRPFAYPVTLGAYATPEVYMAANAIGSMWPLAVAPFGRVVLSPTLYVAQRRRLPAILAHELSHAHIQGWISTIGYVHLPNWFKEGLAVMVSGGGGAEFVSEAEGYATIARGESITIEDSGSLRTCPKSASRAPPRGQPGHTRPFSPIGRPECSSPTCMRATRRALPA